MDENARENKEWEYIMKRMNRPHRKEKRRKEAEERQKVYDSTVDKIALIDSRPGESRKERDRILNAS